jgi:hypothetical protein
MAQDTPTPGQGDHAVADDRSAQDFAAAHGISADDARRLIETLGHDRALLEEAASRLRRSATIPTGGTSAS